MEPDSPEKVDQGLRSAFFSFKRALREQQPTHALVTFDAEGPTWRHARYPAYKANRKPMYGPLREALPAFQARLKAELGLVSIAKPGHEGDDLMAIAYRGWRVRRPGCPAVVLSTDKDMTALVQYGATVYDQFNKVVRGAAWIQDTWGILPHQVQDYLALVGDAVDNLPGVPSVGPKRARELLQAHGSLDAILAADIPGALGRRIAENREVALLSRELVGFRVSETLGLKLTDLVHPAARALIGAL